MAESRRLELGDNILRTLWCICAILHRKRPFCFSALKGGSDATYNVHLRLIGKRVVDFLLVLIELLSLGVTAEVLLVNID